MDTGEIMEALRLKALRDPELRKKIIATHDQPNALTKFCEISTQAGFPLYSMDVIEYGESSYSEAENSVYWALREGYRLIDTAEIYGNEEGVGRGIQRAINDGYVSREEIFVTTKLWTAYYNDAETMRMMRLMLP